MKKISLFALLPSIALAAAAPEKCPSVDAINQHLKYFTHTFCDTNDGRCAVINFDNAAYDTDQNWELIFWIDDAKDYDDARQKASDILPIMTLKSGPTEIRSQAWSCTYGNSFGYAIHAVNYHGWLDEKKINGY